MPNPFDRPNAVFLLEVGGLDGNSFDCIFYMKLIIISIRLMQFLFSLRY
jgi:hypothetical protein